jgi:hypothetical protein
MSAAYEEEMRGEKPKKKRQASANALKNFLIYFRESVVVIRLFKIASDTHVTAHYEPFVVTHSTRPFGARSGWFDS